MRITTILLLAFALVPSIYASDTQVRQGQYYTGNSFNQGTYPFVFTVYDASTGGTSCYSVGENITTGYWGQWRVEYGGIGGSCNDATKDYYLNINIAGVDQIPRRLLTNWNSLRKNVNEVTTGTFQSAVVVASVVNASQVIVTTGIVAPVLRDND
jgi:hypothetical protein